MRRFDAPHQVGRYVAEQVLLTSELGADAADTQRAVAAGVARAYSARIDSCVRARHVNGHSGVRCTSDDLQPAAVLTSNAANGCRCTRAHSLQCVLGIAAIMVSLLAPLRYS